MKVYEEMTVDEVVEYLKNEMDKGRTVKDIEINDFGVAERVIRKRLARKGVKLEIPKVIKEKPSEKNGHTKDNYKSITPVIGQSVANVNKNMLLEIGSIIDINAVNELISLIDPLKEIIENHEKSKSIIEVEPISFKVKVAKDIKSKVFKVDGAVLDKLEQFCSVHSEYKTQDIVSTLLNEALDKYK